MIIYPEKYRVMGPPKEPGMFSVPFESRDLLIIASDGLGWEHISVSLKNRCPNWREMSYIKNLFWNENTWVMQLHPPANKNINIFDNCLHLWAPINGDIIPIPPEIMV